MATAHDLSAKSRTRDVLIKENCDFGAFQLTNPVLQGLEVNGFCKPSPIQLKAIPLARCGFDLIIKSKSGTGKTLVFAITSLELVSVLSNNVQVLILTPTREIAVQVENVIKSIGSQIKGLRVESFIGGLPLEDDVKKLKLCHIAVGAPGRVKHLIDMKVLNTKFVKLLVLDEADKIIQESFIDDLTAIYKTLQKKIQVLAVSATCPDDTYLTPFMASPIHVTPDTDTPLLLGLKQFISVVKFNMNSAQQIKHKIDELIRILSNVVFTQCLVFSNYQSKATSISNTLNRNGWSSIYITSAQSQIERLEVINALRQYKCRILLSTDLTSRGVDLSDVDLVVNFDVPYDASTYLHRMGRAGRYGSHGTCVTLVGSEKELLELRIIIGSICGESYLLPKLPMSSLPSDLWNCDSSQFEFVQGICNVDENAREKITNSIKDIKSLKFKEKKDKTKSKRATKKKLVKKANKTEENVTCSEENQSTSNLQFKPDGHNNGDILFGNPLSSEEYLTTNELQHHMNNENDNVIELKVKKIHKENELCGNIKQEIEDDLTVHHACINETIDKVQKYTDTEENKIQDTFDNSKARISFIAYETSVLDSNTSHDILKRKRDPHFDNVLTSSGTDEDRKNLDSGNVSCYNSQSRKSSSSPEDIAYSQFTKISNTTINENLSRDLGGVLDIETKPFGDISSKLQKMLVLNNENSALSESRYLNIKIEDNIFSKTELDKFMLSLEERRQKSLNRKDKFVRDKSSKEQNKKDSDMFEMECLSTEMKQQTIINRTKLDELEPLEKKRQRNVDGFDDESFQNVSFKIQRQLGFSEDKDNLSETLHLDIKTNELKPSKTGLNEFILSSETKRQQGTTTVDTHHKDVQEDVYGYNFELTQETVSEHYDTVKDNTNDLENIFKLAFDYATKTDVEVSHWLKPFAREINETVSLEDNIGEILDSYEDSVCDEEMSNEHDGFNDYEEQFDEEQHEETPRNNTNGWGEVLQERLHCTNSIEEEAKANEYSNEFPGLYSETEYSHSNHYKSFFDKCSYDLENQGGAHKSVEQFEDWFSRWQWKVKYARKYVQDSIFVQEMSKYVHK